MIKSITIVGCGNIGSRHLQAISKLKGCLDIHIVEPNSNSRKIATSRLNKLPNISRHNYNWHQNIDELSSDTDLTIVSTSSNNRVKLISKLIDKGHSRFLTEKVVCQSKKEYDLLLRILKKNKAKGWINFPRHYFPFYQKIIPMFQTKEPLVLTVTGGNFGLASNTIHFIDLFSWILNTSKIDLTGKFLHQKILSNKRGSLYKEFSGTIIGKHKNSVLSISSFHNSNMSLIVDIFNSKFRIIFDEINQNIIFYEPTKLRKFQFEYIHVSDSTTLISKEILQNDDCNLPTIADSYEQHIELFKTFNSHIKNIKKQKPNLCPIT
ncbi:Gfo/Idh/MocA family oxidoreductase [Nitrosopumilus adriaticus]|uniref:Gfo/Idh/MocA family oxidoreductase n=1 Tax=Nitrosopumilus adriaticus TaxID=1580092 RepID=UPI00352D7CAA